MARARAFQSDVNDVNGAKSSLQKLKEDICNHVDALLKLRPGNDVINTLCAGIAKFKNQDAATFMQSMRNLSNIIAGGTSIEGIKDIHIRYRMDVLCFAFVNYNFNIDTWSNISTLEELISVQQKNFIQSSILGKINTFPKNTQPAYRGLHQQITDSETSTPLSDLFKKDSLFLEARVYVGEGVKPRTLSNDQFPSIRTILGDFSLQTNEKEFLGWMQDYIVVTDPKAVLGMDNENSKEEERWREKNLAIHTALVEMRQDYIKRGRSTHLKCIDQLIKAVTTILNHAESKDSNAKNHEIISEVKKAFATQQQKFVNSTFSGLFKRDQHMFEEKLKHDDNSFCFPRMLKNILDKHTMTEEHKVGTIDRSKKTHFKRY